jgi:hypothetical protein
MREAEPKRWETERTVVVVSCDLPPHRLHVRVCSTAHVAAMVGTHESFMHVLIHATHWWWCRRACLRSHHAQERTLH